MFTAALTKARKALEARISFLLAFPQQKVDLQKS